MTSEPAYYRVATALRTQMKEGGLKPGSQLPSEAELVEEFQVSRNTVRRALGVLNSMNLVTSHRGRGTFVATQGLSHVIGQLKSFTEVLVDLGFTPGMRDLTIRSDAHPPIEAIEFFRATDLWRVTRLRTVDDRPFALMNSWVTASVGGELRAGPMTASGSLYRTLRDECGVILSEATEVIRAEAALPSEAKHLDVTRGTPLIVMYRWVYDLKGQPAEYVRSVSPGDRYQYLAKLRA